MSGNAHVTLSTGIVSIAASSVGIESHRLAWLLLAISGIAVMFVLNLSVSFARRLIRSPLSFVRPPRPSTTE